MPGNRTHEYHVAVRWTGNLGTGTSGYRDFSRAHEIAAEGKPTLTGSADPAFRGDAREYNPEDLLVASLSACHMLWFLHLCAVKGLIVEAYEDNPEGIMVEDDSGGGRFRAVTLRPRVVFGGKADPSAVEACHHEAHEKCFIANSMNFPVTVEPVY
ncbi:OsmC family protein [Ectothiorhodospiraceae bacterium WFHF3C12]|nr:OsmC family protein [Ectothiorhodospiraceae bacterium WFHF3C12]